MLRLSHDFWHWWMGLSAETMVLVGFIADVAIGWLLLSIMHTNDILAEQAAERRERRGNKRKHKPFPVKYDLEDYN